MKIDLDKLPIKRLGAIEESGIEHFPPDTDYEEKRLDAIRRIDFSWVVERDSKKLKTSEEEAAAPSATPPVWPWQGLVENLKVAHEELSVIIDIINTVEANDAVTVAGMQRPKQLPNEVLSDLAVSAATKLQRLRHLGRYFKQSSKALEQQVAREARFYGSLIRLQQNWKTKRQRLGASGPGSEGFIIDLQDNSSSDLLAFSHLSTLSMVRVEQDSAGILAVQLPQKSCRSIFLRFLGAHPSSKQRSFLKRKIYGSGEHPREAKKEALSDEDVNARVKESHSILREIHRSIFQEQIFDMVSGEAHNPSPGVNVTGMREDFLQLAIGQETSVCLCLEPSVKEDDTQTVDSTGQTPDEDSDPLGLTIIDEKQDPLKRISLARPNPISLEIYLQYIFHESVLVRAKGKHPAATRLQVSSQPTTDGCGLLGHFSLTVAHRILSSKVLSVLEQLVNGVPYLHLLSHPTWHCRTSSWSLSLKVPQSIFHAGAQIKTLDTHDVKSGYRSQYHTKILVNDDQISVSGEGAPSIIDSFRGTSADVCSINSYGCILEDLPMVILQQAASQVIHWLHEEAMLVGMKANKDFLGLYFDLDLGETLGLVAHVNPGDTEGCISWWLVMEDDGSPEKEKKLSTEENSGEGANRRYLGHLSLQALYSMMMDLVTLCSTGGTR